MGSRGIPLLVALVALGSGCGGRTAAPASARGAGPERFAVRLHRPSRVGQRGKISASGERHASMRVAEGGAIVHREDLRIRFEALDRVMAVDERGNEVHSEYLVERFETEERGQVHALVPRGETIVVRRAETQEAALVTVGGEHASDAVRRALHLVVSMTTHRGQPSDDEVFGTPQPQALGASWPVNAAFALRQLEGFEGTLDGSARLVRRASFEGIDCLEIAAELNGTMTALPGLPPGAVLRSGRIEASFRGLKPVAPALPTLASGYRMSMEASLEMQADGRTIDLQMSFAEQVLETYTPQPG